MPINLLSQLGPVPGVANPHRVPGNGMLIRITHNTIVS